MFENPGEPRPPLPTPMYKISIGRNSFNKLKIAMNTMQKISPEYSSPLPRNRQKNEMISLGYYVNDHVYSKTKSI